MFTIIRRYSVRPDQMQTAIERVRHGLVPLVSKQPGFLSYHALDAGDNVAVSVSCYQNRATADAGNLETATWVQSQLSQLQPIDVTGGDVLVAASTTSNAHRPDNAGSAG